MEQSISRLLRDGYVGRNPITPNYAFRARSDAYELIITGNTGGFPVLNPTSSGFAFVGISGVGKSSANYFNWRATMTISKKDICALP
jgi:hypothetical protein